MYETKNFFREYHSILVDLNQEITFESKSMFAFHERYAAIRTWKQLIDLLSENLDYMFHRKYTITKSWQERIVNMIGSD